jgi:hypothetical protein
MHVHRGLAAGVSAAVLFRTMSVASASESVLLRHSPVAVSRHTVRIWLVTVVRAFSIVGGWVAGGSGILLTGATAGGIGIGAVAAIESPGALSCGIDVADNPLDSVSDNAPVPTARYPTATAATVVHNPNCVRVIFFMLASLWCSRL